MKEKFFNNMIFIFFTILLLIFSLKCFLIAFHVIEEKFLIEIINNNINLVYSSLTNQILLGLAGLLLFIIALYLIWLKQKMTQQIPSVKITTDDGEIKISTTSLGQIILNILQSVEGIKEITPDIQIQKSGGIRAILQLIVSKDCNIPDTAHYIQQKLKEDLPKISGVEVNEVKINVNKIDYNI
jgi:uncharacterized alkaline shock family protein YloU